MKRCCRIVAWTLLALACGPVRAEDYPQTNGWSFNNFKTPSLPWDVYRDTFIGTPPEDDPVAAGFDSLFYHQAYETALSAAGNCYGMSLLSLMMLDKGGHLGYCLPIAQYSGDIFNSGDAAMGPDDAMLKRAINIMHGHQVNLPTVQYFLQIFAQHHNRDAAFAYQTLVDSQLKKDLTLVSITQGLNPSDGGHTLVAYKGEDLGGGSRRIYVYDPNRTWANPDGANRGWYQNAQNFIEISNTSWKFTMAGTIGVWQGDPGSGGNIVIVPISTTGPHARSPASLGDQIIGKILNELFLSGQSASVTQVSDAQGRRLFTPGTLEVDTDPSTGMLTMMPWYRSDAAGDQRNAATVLFRIGAGGGALQLEIRAGDSGYALRSAGQRSQLVLTARGGTGTDLVTIDEPAIGAPRVAVENRRGTAEYDLEFTQAARPGQPMRIMTVRSLKVPDQAVADFQVADRQQALIVHTAAAALRYDLELTSVTRDGRDSLIRRHVVQPAETSQFVRPRHWNDLAHQEVLERLSPRGTEAR